MAGSCSKSVDIEIGISRPVNTGNNYTSLYTNPNYKDSILIDASKDGGTWWFPQTGSFDPTLNHQGKALVAYLESSGFKVRELGRGAQVTWDLLKRYRKVIRAGSFGNYTSVEIAAYDSLLSYPSSLLLLNDHMTNFPNDQLAEHWGLKFVGIVQGTMVVSGNHPTIAGVTSLPYSAGSELVTYNKNNVTILGVIHSANAEAGKPVMGILHHPKAKIFFIGDVNGIEIVPQPFTQNLITWLF